jgi:hypothetical protein
VRQVIPVLTCVRGGGHIDLAFTQSFGWLLGVDCKATARPHTIHRSAVQQLAGDLLLDYDAAEEVGVVGGQVLVVWAVRGRVAPDLVVGCRYGLNAACRRRVGISTLCTCRSRNGAESTERLRSGSTPTAPPYRAHARPLRSCRTAACGCRGAWR